MAGSGGAGSDGMKKRKPTVGRLMQEHADDCKLLRETEARIREGASLYPGILVMRHTCLTKRMACIDKKIQTMLFPPSPNVETWKH